MFEMRQETDYVVHHVQKVLAFFSAMRSFSDFLNSEGKQVVYYDLDHPENTQNLTENLQQLIEQHQIERFEYQLPDEYRLDQQLKVFCEQLEIASGAVDTEHFMAPRDGLSNYFGKKNYLMESFYRDMRRKYDIMMDDGQPTGGKWNYDAENRKKLPKGHEPVAPKYFEKDLSKLYALLQKQGVKTIGRVEAERFIWPTTRAEGLEMLEFFAQECLPLFGTYQDAMTENYWSLYHSRLSFLMNAKILSPKEVVDRCIVEWEERPDEIQIHQTEGFVRQIIGWREYMRGIYWEKMPEYAQLNFFGYSRKLPKWYWTGETMMNCMKHAIDQSLDYSYAHHIQRLMVTGNFALLAGIDPDEVDQWYLGIYIDAIEWVEITNTRGMSQFADGGIVGTKPYVSSANYIHKMSDYCKGCYYSNTKKTGEKSCPFNSFYWNFVDRHRDQLEKNPRIGMMYRTWDRMSAEKKQEYLEQAAIYLDQIEEL